VEGFNAGGPVLVGVGGSSSSGVKGSVFATDRYSSTSSPASDSKVRRASALVFSVYAQDSKTLQHIDRKLFNYRSIITQKQKIRPSYLGHRLGNGVAMKFKCNTTCLSKSATEISIPFCIMIVYKQHEIMQDEDL